MKSTTSSADFFAMTEGLGFENDSGEWSIGKADLLSVVKPENCTVGAFMNPVTSLPDAFVVVELSDDIIFAPMTCELCCGVDTIINIANSKCGEDALAEIKDILEDAKFLVEKLEGMTS